MAIGTFPDFVLMNFTGFRVEVVESQELVTTASPNFFITHT